MILLEGICADMRIEDKEPTRNLTDKLHALAERGLVRSEIVDNLFALKFIGDEAIHHLQVPSDEELELGIRIAESLIRHLYKESEYLLESQTQNLAKKHLDIVEQQKQKRAKRPKNAA